MFFCQKATVYLAEKKRGGRVVNGIIQNAEWVCSQCFFSSRCVTTMRESCSMLYGTRFQMIWNAIPAYMEQGSSLEITRRLTIKLVMGVKKVAFNSLFVGL